MLGGLLADPGCHQGAHHARDQAFFVFVWLGEVLAQLLARLGQPRVRGIGAQLFHHVVQGRKSIFRLARQGPRDDPRELVGDHAIQGAGIGEAASDTRRKTSCGFLPVKGSIPVAIWYSITPTEKTSLRKSSVRPSITSGAM